MQNYLTTILKQASLFTNLNRDELKNLEDIAIEISVPQNTKFIQEDAEEKCFYLLLSGELLVTKKGKSNEENVIAEISGVRIIGETGLLGGERRSASVKTLQPSTLLRFDAETIKKFPTIHTTILDNIAHELSRKLRDMNIFTSAQIERTDDLKKTMTLDALTGAFNRLYLMDLLTNLEQHALRYNSTFAILMVDIDDFKKINDTYGHPTGDTALKAFVKTAESNIRKPDCVCRYGGEEFLIILHNCSLKQAIVSADRIRESVSKISLAYNTYEIHLTVSIGVASFHNPYDDVEKLIARADEALYLAKGEGKNLVRCKENFT